MKDAPWIILKIDRDTPLRCVWLRRCPAPPERTARFYWGWDTAPGNATLFTTQEEADAAALEVGGMAMLRERNPDELFAAVEMDQLAAA